MKKCRFFAALIFGIIFQSLIAFAQEQGGNGVPQERQQRQQQQHRVRWRERHEQSQQAFYFKQNVMRGEEAQKLFEQYSVVDGKSNIENLTRKCSEPVDRVSFGRSDSSRAASVCFDRGEGFTHSTRFKCYVKNPEKLVNPMRQSIFNFYHNECGGDGIHPRRQQ